MQLRNKTAVIYGASGFIGASVAKAFAREGARVFVTGKNKEAIATLVSDIAAAGGFAEGGVVDVLNEQAVKNHLEQVINKEGKIDISFNAAGIGQEGVQGIPLTGLSPEAYVNPVLHYSRSHFITSTAAAKYMAALKKGVVITLTAAPVKLPAPLLGGMAAAWAAVEAMTRTLAGEMGAHGVRAVCLRADGIPETETITEVFGLHAQAYGMPSHKEFQGLMESLTLLKRLPNLQEVAGVAVFLASDNASAITGTVINVTCGSVID
jgi:NAD(P)-dependent dehydrogenase (short-subunit alcohol dehydrogenase family)